MGKTFATDRDLDRVGDIADYAELARKAALKVQSTSVGDEERKHWQADYERWVRQIQKLVEELPITHYGVRFSDAVAVVPTSDEAEARDQVRWHRMAGGEGAVAVRSYNPQAPAEEWEEVS